ncbi:histidine phosphatase family protein [Salisediminibacterium beveridgei]|uniref:Alpha-ribazole-5'-phosphate phosphatase n=1 Tax=Salisediminibacterium beveridgei TaxID=632773 RepID=A0A1D7QXT3_9BACI|nr:histidine phosphatase family protein [Salisediminibacterium beveridgei]AOM83827.1 Alpha-ribazole-5'-phosphate phosphatase [Salisediminibacterium beveridgei]
MIDVQEATIYLIRHGATGWNQTGRYLGHTNEPILEESYPVIDKLKTVADSLENPIVTSSDLLRCTQTASRLFPDTAIHFDHRLREMNFGDWEGKTKEDLKQNPDFDTWLYSFHESTIPNGEGAAEFSNRVLGWWTEYANRPDLLESSHVIVAHGGVIRVLMTHLTGTGLETFWDWRIPHGTAIRLTLTKQQDDYLASDWIRLP